MNGLGSGSYEIYSAGLSKNICMLRSSTIMVDRSAKSKTLLDYFRNLDNLVYLTYKKPVVTNSMGSKDI